ncbi:glycosyltransferase family 2 protein, partial [bacterium]|nr:glycosyltransferase family 2 protein [bacterium]
MADIAEVKVLALIPAYNEGERVLSVVRGAQAYLPVLVVDDGSTDLTAQFARQAGAEVIQQQPNQGKGTALIAGFSVGLERGYQAVITLDADGQHDPAEIPAFLAAYREQQSDLIIGKRDFKAMPWVRRLSNT